MIDHLTQLAIHGYYVGEHDVGRRACDRLLGMDITSDLRHQTMANLTWYSQPLDELCDCRFSRIDVEPAQPGWSLFNPTVIDHNGRLLAIVRSSNYRIEGGAYVMPDADAGVIRTENLLVDLHNDMTVRSSRVIAGPEYDKTDYPVDGLEDCRLRHTPGGVGVSATVRNVAPYDGRCRIATADLDVDAAAFSNLRVLACSVSQEHEKNWMPLSDGWVYACCGNGHVLTVDPDPQVPGGWQICRRGKSPLIATEFRGGSQLVPFDGGWLCVVHEVVHASQRVYMHRFAWLNNAMAIDRVSPAFYFRERHAIEFSAGLAVHGDRTAVTFGVRDEEAWAVSVASDDICRALMSVSSLGTSG